MKVRVWAYRDGDLLPLGFECDVQSPEDASNNEGIAPPWDTIEGERATSRGVIAVAESAGLDVCVGTDQPGDFNADVDRWEDA